MELNDLYDIAERENIKIYDWYIEDANGIYVNIDKINAIALNYNNLDTCIEEKQVLAEELGHYYMDATYPLYSKDTILMSKQEYRAKKWSYNTLISFDKLKIALKNGIKNIYDLANYFNVTSDYMQNAINFYINKYGLQMIDCFN